jgi:hypothetical protein
VTTPLNPNELSRRPRPSKIPDEEKILICGYDPADDRVIVCIGLKGTLTDGDVGQARGVDALATIRIERDKFAEWLTGINSWFNTIVPGVSGAMTLNHLGEVQDASGNNRRARRGAPGRHR